MSLNNLNEAPIPTSDYVDSNEHFTSVINRMADQHEPVQSNPTAAAFLESLRVTRVTSSTLESYSNNGCAICTDSFAVDDKAMRLPCKHAYHKDCIVRWLNKSNTCPLCREKLPEEKLLHPSPKRRRQARMRAVPFTRVQLSTR